jgi:lysophospholipase L1-like esterase
MRLFTFGDSFTEGYCDYSIWSTSYIKWKGYKPKIFSELISENMNIELINYGVGGYDNYSILESFFKHYSEINEDDLVLINWSSFQRFRVVKKSGGWITIIPNFENIIDDIDISQTTIEEILVNRDSDELIDEVNHWIDYINITNKKIRIINWTPFTNKLNCYFFGGYETILDETNGKISDGHFSENGQIQLYKDIIRIIKEDPNKKKLI